MSKKKVFKDRTGEKINNWTFIKFVGLGAGNNARWLCECSCGTRVVRQACNISSGGSKQCMKCAGRAKIKNYENEIPRPAWKTITRNADQSGRKISVSKKFLYNLFLKQNRKCAITGLEIKFAINLKEFNGGIQTASLDRIDSNKGYSKNNVQWVHKDVNKLKNIFSTDKLIYYCKLIAENNK